MDLKILTTIGCTLALTGLAQADIVNDIQEYWTMDGNANAAIDSTFDATFTGDSETYVAGKFGLGIDLERDGLLDYLTIGGPEDAFDHVGEDITISLWISSESLSTQWQAMMANGEGSAWRLARWSNGNGTAYAGGVADIGHGDISTPGFHHVVGITEHGVETRLWVDGVKLTGGVPSLTDDDDDTSPTMIGNNPDSPLRAWDGVIDDVGVWDAALSDEDVLRLWNDGDGRSIASVIPEPSVGMLVLLGAIVASRFRRG